MARKSHNLPSRFPVGTKYVVEGASNAAGKFHVTRRYVLLPGGRQFDLPAVSRTVRKLSTAPSIVPKTTRSPTVGRPSRTTARVGC